MPLLYQQNINPGIQMAVWKIEEPLGYFLKEVTAYRDIAHPHKQLQHLAGRLLLTKLLPSDGGLTIGLYDSGKPFLKNKPDWHFSVSHSSQFAAAIVSTQQSVGIDIEMIDSKASKLHHRFLAVREMELLKSVFSDTAAAATAGWCVKEALFKWYGKGSVDFIKDMRIMDIRANGIEKQIECYFEKEIKAALRVHLHAIDSMLLAWVAA